jgi:PPOX class probable F420-dependent enzyme
MELQEAVEAARQHHQSTLVTLRSDGLPQLSNVVHAVGEDGIVRVSTTADRAKTANLRRRPWAALKLDAGSFWSYAVLEGSVALSPVAAAPDDPTVEELVVLYRTLSGEHPDWADYREAMAREQRCLLRVTVTKAGPDRQG